MKTEGEPPKRWLEIAEEMQDKNGNDVLVAPDTNLGASGLVYVHEDGTLGDRVENNLMVVHHADSELPQLVERPSHNGAKP